MHVSIESFFLFLLGCRTFGSKHSHTDITHLGMNTFSIHHLSHTVVHCRNQEFSKR